MPNTMNSSPKIAYSRLLYADFIQDETEEKKIIQKLNMFGFREELQKDNMALRFSTAALAAFINQLRSSSSSDVKLLDYVNNIVFWIFDDGILPLKVAIIEVILKIDDLQKLGKSDLESKIWKLSHFLGNCFIEGLIPLSNSCKDFRILKFSSRVISNVVLRNFVAEFVFEAEQKFFDDFNKKLNSLEREISRKDLIEQKIIEARDNGKILPSQVGKVISEATSQPEQKINDIKNNIISLEPVSFLGDGFSYDQSIVRGYANKIFIIGKIQQGSLNNSTPLYLATLSLGPLVNLESMPVLQFPGKPSLLNFSSGAGQIIELQLLNSWNRYVETSIKKITTKQNPTQMKTNMDADETLEELRNLMFHMSIYEKISVNYRGELQDLANPSNKTFLYELLIPPEAGTPYSTDPEKYGLEKLGPIVSNLAALILKNLELNEKNLLDAIDLRRSKINVLKIEADRKYSRSMVCLTVVIAAATILNVVLFLIRL